MVDNLSTISRQKIFATENFRDFVGSLAYVKERNISAHGYLLFYKPSFKLH